MLLYSSPDSTLEQRLNSRGYSQDTIEDVYSGYEEQNIQHLFRTNPESQGERGELTFEEYKENFEFDYRKRLFRTFVDRHQEVLEDAEEQFGVDYRYVASIIGVETGFGTYTGSNPVADTYKTIHETVEDRREFALEQSECLLQLVEADRVNPDMEGSYAGALGYGQFIPCSVKEYYIGDIEDMEDTIYSVANYLKNNTKTHPDRESYTQWDPQRNGEPIEVQEGNYYALWAYNHSSLYVRIVDALARTIER